MKIGRSAVAILLVTTAIQTGIVSGPTKAAASSEELKARVEKLEKETAALRKENRLCARNSGTTILKRSQSRAGSRNRHPR